MTTSTRRRAYVFPKPGDTVSTLAARLLPGEEDATKRLLSWNLHLVTRRSITGSAGVAGDPGLLSTDIVYTEPPLA